MDDNKTGGAASPLLTAFRTGGPAFPFVQYEGTALIAYGMTVRDYFAAQAIPVATKWEEASPTYDGPSFRGIAERAYSLADAMLAAREAA